MTTEPTTATWSRTVDCRRDRLAALLAGIAEIPRGPAWDVVVRHAEHCPAVQIFGELPDCTCGTVTLEARRLG